MTPVNKTLERRLLSLLHYSLIASCQPVDEGPMDETVHVVAMALAAVAGGAGGLRIEGVERVRAVATATDTPIVGIVKRDLPDSPVRITPFIEDVQGLAEAGASIIAFDATERTRPTPCAELLQTIHESGCIGMVDCSTFEEGLAMAKLGCTFISSTLSGYTDSTDTPTEPDLDLVRRWAARGYTVMAEGRYNSPQWAAQAITAGAWGVTVGSAITRVEHIASWFADSIRTAAGELGCQT